MRKKITVQLTEPQLLLIIGELDKCVVACDYSKFGVMLGIINRKLLSAAIRAKGAGGENK